VLPETRPLESKYRVYQVRWPVLEGLWGCGLLVEPTSEAVAHEYAKVCWLYAQLGLADRTEIEFFQGGHSMRAEGSFDFLHRHLGWPKPTTRGEH
jgi:hypothetical protein